MTVHTATPSNRSACNEHPGNHSGKDHHIRHTEPQRDAHGLHRNRLVAWLEPCLSSIAVPSPWMQPTPPAGWYRDPHSRFQLRWWNGQAWTERTGLRPRWNTILLWSGLAIPIWLVGSALSIWAGSDVAEPDRAVWVAAFDLLTVFPIVVAALLWVLIAAVTRRSPPGTHAAGATLLCLSILLIYIVIPTPAMSLGRVRRLRVRSSLGVAPD